MEELSKEWSYGERVKSIRKKVRSLIHMGECAVSWAEDLKVGSSIPAVARGNLIFPAQKDERRLEQLHSPGVMR